MNNRHLLMYTYTVYKDNQISLIFFCTFLLPFINIFYLYNFFYRKYLVWFMKVRTLIDLCLFTLIIYNALN